MTLFLKSVSVFDPTVEIYGLNLFVDVVDFGVTQSAPMPHSFRHDTVRTDGSIKFIFQLGCYQRFFVGWLCDRDLRPTNHFVGGGLSSIFESNYDEDFIPMLRQWFIQHHALQDVGTLWKNIGAQLPPPSSNHDEYGYYEGGKLQERGDASDCGYFIAQAPSDKPTIAPLFWSIGSVVLGFLFSLWGLLNLDDERRLWGAALLGCGLLLGAGGFLMWAVPL